MDTIAKVTSLLVEYAPLAASVLAGLVLALAAIAPMTKTKADDKLLGALTKLQGALAWLLVKLTPRAAGKALAAESVRQATRVADKK